MTDTARGAITTGDQRPEGVAWQIFAVMDGQTLRSIVAKNPSEPYVIDITEDVAALLHHARSAPPDRSESKQPQAAP